MCHSPAQPMISELDVVVLARDLEFTNPAGDTLAVVTVPADAVRAVSDALPHALATKS